MFLKSIDKGITAIVLSTFLVVSAVPAKGSGSRIETLTDTEAVFGWCKLRRIKRKTKAVVKSIEEFKRGEKSVEEVTLQIASLKKSANKAFEKNYKVKKIMQRANSKIEKFMQGLVDEKLEQEEDYSEENYAKGTGIKSCDLSVTNDSINLFLSNLQDYEDNDWSEESLEDELRILNEEQKINYHARNLDNTESKILFAYVSVFCGCLLCMIPLGVTQTAGGALISGGFWAICEDNFVNQDEINKKNRERE